MQTLKEKYNSLDLKKKLKVLTPISNKSNKNLCSLRIQTFKQNQLLL
jgi:hypothetical protein